MALLIISRTINERVSFYLLTPVIYEKIRICTSIKRKKGV